MSRRSSTRRNGGSFGRIIAAIVITALASIALTLTLTGQRGAVGGALNDGMATIGNIVSAPAKWVGSGANWFSSLFAGSDEVRKLRRENEALLEWRSQARAMAERLDAYSKLHNVQIETSPGGVTARLVSEVSGPFSRAGLVNAGENQGIKLNWVVINQYGLLGRVISVGKNSSRIIFLSDNSSKLAVMGEISRARAIMIGDKSDAPYLEHLNMPPIIGAGERLVTSGDDGIIPRGIAIGTAGKAPDGKWRVRLNTNGRGIDFVRLLPPNNFPPPLARVTMPVVAPPDATTIGAAGAVLPLNPNAAAIPTTSSPKDIAAAQAARTGQSATSQKAVDTRSAATKAEPIANVKENNSATAPKAKTPQPMDVKIINAPQPATKADVKATPAPVGIDDDLSTVPQTTSKTGG